MATREATVEELRQESERSRQALALSASRLRQKLHESTLNLQTKLSPEHLKQEARRYVRDERETLVQSLQKKAKENPLQAAAIGAAVAYPAVGLLRAIPMPLWLIGAGLFFTTRAGQQSAADLREKAAATMATGAESLGDLAAGVKDNVQRHADRARSGLEEATEAIGAGVTALRGSAASVLRDAGQADIRADTKSAQVKTPTSSWIGTYLKDNTLVVAGIGAAVGAFIAAKLPPSESENRLFGAGSEKIKDAALRQTARGFDKISDVATGAMAAAASAAAREGLDTEGLSRAVNSVLDSVTATAEHAVLAAADSASKENSPEGNAS